ncbi:MAG: glucose-1-phosphate adenylyltransferase [Burkholderiaceae bacterium]
MEVKFDKRLEERLRARATEARPSTGAAQHSAAAISAPPLAGSALALVLCGGRGSRLGPLTDRRAKPAVSFGGSFRIVDFTLANCVNSGLRRIAVLTQYKAQSLIRHIAHSWALNRRFGEFVEVVPAQQRLGDSWYSGTADAVYQNIELIERHQPDHVLVLGGDHVYKMDYTKLLAEHAARRADLTVACVEVACEDASEFGVMQVDAQERVLGFQEKPERPIPMPGSRDRTLASMGIYVFDSATLIRELVRDATKDSSHDFGHDVVPHMLRSGARVFAHSFNRSWAGPPGSTPYWRDVGTLDSYWQANIELTQRSPGLDMFDPAWPIPADADHAMPSRFLLDDKGHCAIVKASLTGSGCVIGAADIQRCVLASNVSIGHGAGIEESVLLSGVEVAAGVRLRRVIVDKHCRLPPGLVAGFDAAQDSRRFHVSPRGITLITPEMLGQQGPLTGRPETGLAQSPHRA